MVSLLLYNLGNNAYKVKHIKSRFNLVITKLSLIVQRGRSLETYITPDLTLGKDLI